MMICAHTRRQFLKTSMAGALAAIGAGRSTPHATADESPVANTSRVALTNGEDHVDIVFGALRPFGREVAQAIGDRQVVIKPNNVAIDIPLSATPAECLEGTLEFLKSIGKLDGALIAESAANGPTLEGFSNYSYDKLATKYGVKLVDLDNEKTERVFVFDEKDFQPHPVRMSRLLLDRDNFFVVSAAKFKTHDQVVATLSLKNIVIGAPVKDPGFRSERKRKPGLTSQKPIAHGSGIYGITATDVDDGTGGTVATGVDGCQSFSSPILRIHWRVHSTEGKSKSATVLARKIIPSIRPCRSHRKPVSHCTLIRSTGIGSFLPKSNI